MLGAVSYALADGDEADLMRRMGFNEKAIKDTIQKHERLTEKLAPEQKSDPMTAWQVEYRAALVQDKRVLDRAREDLFQTVAFAGRLRIQLRRVGQRPFDGKTLSALDRAHAAADAGFEREFNRGGQQSARYNPLDDLDRQQQAITNQCNAVVAEARNYAQLATEYSGHCDYYNQYVETSDVDAAAVRAEAKSATDFYAQVVKVMERVNEQARQDVQTAKITAAVEAASD